MSTRDSRQGSTGGADIPGHVYGGPDDDYTPEQLATMRREDLDALGAKYDGVEVLHADPGPEPGSPLERRAVRQVGLVLTLVFHDRLEDDGRGDWVWIMACGVLLGLIGLRTVRRRRDALGQTPTDDPSTSEPGPNLP